MLVCVIFLKFLVLFKRSALFKLQQHQTNLDKDH